MKQKLKNEPVLIAVLVPILVSLAARHGFELPASGVADAVTAIAALAGLIARQMVRPVARDAQAPKGGA